MGDRNTVQQSRGVLDVNGPQFENRQWIVAKSLLEVNDACTRTLEDLVFHATRPDADDRSDQLKQQIDDMIRRHERLVAELELAREAIDGPE
ncbi:hypothetical protein [Halobacterium litoreum]|uniref:DUF8103 domain-containing protein n=1 Tax=Halobacterium litoreum TaxID=2039234 RepID=A0ABD5NDI8_9EURY|nr:hypothetical protein [Halobacterium litoreum]UHH13707.1 hypothetical protein LT972_01620 [Halobacterium litoreum]